jgi:hypothetical protein
MGDSRSSGRASEPPPTSRSCILGKKSPGFSVFIESTPVNYLGSNLAQPWESAIRHKDQREAGLSEVVSTKLKLSLTLISAELFNDGL